MTAVLPLEGLGPHPDEVRRHLSALESYEAGLAQRTDDDLRAEAEREWADFLAGDDGPEAA